MLPGEKSTGVEERSICIALLQNFRKASNMNYQKCELINGIGRYICAAAKRGTKWVSLPLEDFLAAMQYDHRGGLDQLHGVLLEMHQVFGCTYTIEAKNHGRLVVFGVARSSGSKG